uniref:Uncharacterized protein n=1 Tax=Anopheles atroparvus TaxID=41427 RepID=A0AAG5CWS7_ANOAO
MMELIACSNRVRGSNDQASASIRLFETALAVHFQNTVHHGGEQVDNSGAWLINMICYK